MSKRHDKEEALKFGPFRDGRRIPWFTLDDLLAIYQQVGTNHMYCPAGCHECCKKGTEVSALEQMLLETFCAQRGIPLMSKGTIAGMCPYVAPMGLCMIYPVRPFMCRVYGLTEGKDVSCMLGRKPVNPPYKYNDMRDLFRDIMYMPGKMLKKPTPGELHVAVLKLVVQSEGKVHDGQEGVAQCDAVSEQADQGAIST